MFPHNKSSAKKTSVYKTLIVDHFLKSRKSDLLNMLKVGSTRCLLIDWFELMNVSDIVFTNLVIDPDRWFPKLDAILSTALQQLREQLPQVQIKRLLYQYRNHIEKFELELELVFRLSRKEHCCRKMFEYDCGLCPTLQNSRRFQFPNAKMLDKLFLCWVKKYLISSIN